MIPPRTLLVAAAPLVLLAAACKSPAPSSTDPAPQDAAPLGIVKAPILDASPPPADPAKIAEIVRGVRRAGPARFEVTEHARGLYRDRSSNIYERSRVTRLGEDGASTIRLFGVRPTDVPGALGLENGDALVLIAGRPVQDEKTALDALLGLFDSDARTLSIRIGRAGRELDLEYAIVAD